ncbi:MAG: HD domain-containing protein [Bacillota bacterium]
MNASRAGEEPGHRLRHGLRTADIATWLAHTEALAGRIDPLSLRAACLFHDLGKIRDDAGGDHAAVGAERALSLLAGKTTPEQLDTIYQSIYWHNKRDESPSELPEEARLLQDADLIDHFGATEIWLIGYRVAARRGTAGDFLREYREAASWRRYALCSLNYPSSRREMRRRMCIGAHFFMDFSEEMGNHCAQLGGEPT